MVDNILRGRRVRIIICSSFDNFYFVIRVEFIFSQNCLRSVDYEIKTVPQHKSSKALHKPILTS